MPTKSPNAVSLANAYHDIAGSTYVADFSDIDCDDVFRRGDPISEWHVEGSMAGIGRAFHHLTAVAMNFVSLVLPG